MSVGFSISEVEIANFRGVSGLRLPIGDALPTYLIGGNNTGKTTVLNAIALALGGGGFHRFSPATFDFHRPAEGNHASEFSIRLHFAPKDGHTLPAVQGVGSPTPVHGILVKGTNRSGGRLSHQTALCDADGEFILYSTRTPLKGSAKEQYSGQGLGWNRTYARPWDIKEYIPDVWLLRADNLNRSLYEWKTGPLQRLARLLSQRFLEDKWDLDHDGKQRHMPDTMFQVHEFFRQAVAEFPFWKEDVQPRLEATLTKYLGRQARLGLQPDVQTLEEWLSQQLAASFSADSGGPLTPLDRMGDGWQSLVRIAALDALREFSDDDSAPVVLLFEEPETYLHPHLRRKLRDVLGELARAGWYVVCSTHGPEFISFTDDQRIARLWKTHDSVSQYIVETSSLSKSTKFQEKLDEQGNHEIFFANRVILCEGKDDAFALSEFLDKNQVDVDGRSVSILAVNGVGNLVDYARLAGQLGIPWCAITDEDVESDGTPNQKTARVRAELGKAKTLTDLTCFWPGNLESCFGLTDGSKATPEWQQTNVVPLSAADVSSKYPEFSQVAEAVATWTALET